MYAGISSQYITVEPPHCFSKLIVNNRFTDSQVSVDSPRQVKELGHDEFKDFVDVDVVCRA